MKKGLVLTALSVILIFTAAFSSGCSELDADYGKSDRTAALKTESVTSSDVNKPSEILSSDTVMPKYFDISLFDEENYSQVYLGKKFKLEIKYDGVKLSVPTTIKKLKNSDFVLNDDSHYNDDSMILAGSYAQLGFVNPDGKELTGTLYNSSDSSQPVSKCKIVTLSIGSNSLTGNDNYGEFELDGLKSGSSIDDVIRALGTPSHFYATAPDNYYFDYFISADDRRNGITVYVDPVNDNVTAIELSSYK